jgi:flagellar biosynthetic protein FliP
MRGTAPVKEFMIRQVRATGHEHYLTELYDYAVPPSPDRVDPKYFEQLPFPVISAAFLLSEMTTALFIGFAIFLPFLVIDLVVAAILSSLGLFLVPPSQVALPLKLVAFALAEGWWLVTDMLLRSFALG